MPYSDIIYYSTLTHSLEGIQRAIEDEKPTLLSIRHERILYLSDNARALFNHITIPSSVKVSVVGESVFSYEVQKTCDSEKADKIARLTESGSIDLVIIQNNVGAGLGKAVAVAPNMRADKSCIFWSQQVPPNIFPPEGRGLDTNTSRGPYVHLGYTQFYTHAGLRTFLEEYFRESQIRGINP